MVVRWWWRMAVLWSVMMVEEVQNKSYNYTTYLHCTLRGFLLTIASAECRVFYPAPRSGHGEPGRRDVRSAVWCPLQHRHFL